MSDEVIVRVQEVVKGFGKVKAVQGLSFSVNRGQVVGFIGANGAGKTTTLRMLATLESPDAGQVDLFGFNSVTDPKKIRARLGWMPDQYGTYSNVTVEDFLDFYARSYGLTGKKRVKRVTEIMEFTDLTSLKDRMMSQLSKGMGQRLCLGKALINDPELLLMDEPAAGLDPKARVEFKNLVRILSNQGKTLIISSHILSELEEMCDSLIFIDHGTLIHQGPAAALLQKDSGLIRLEIRVTGDVNDLIAWGKYQERLTFVDETKKGVRFDCHVTSNNDLSALLKKAIQNQLDVYYFSVEERKLEDIFIEIVNQQKAKK